MCAKLKINFTVWSLHLLLAFSGLYKPSGGSAFNNNNHNNNNNSTNLLVLFRAVIDLNNLNYWNLLISKSF